MNILGIVCSPKKGRHTDTLVDTVAAGALGDGDTYEKIYINDLKFVPCQDCGYCRRVNGCCYRDDMQMVYDRLMEADGIIVGSALVRIIAQTPSVADLPACVAAKIREIRKGMDA